MIDYTNYIAKTVDKRDLLGAWRWLIGTRLSLWHPTTFGNALLKDASGRVHVLDTLEGSVSLVANSEAEFAAKMCDPDTADLWLLAALVDGAARRGMVPGAEQCLHFKIPPQLGGPIDLDNVEITSLFVAFAISGQLRRQIEDSR